MCELLDPVTYDEEGRSRPWGRTVLDCFRKTSPIRHVGREQIYRIWRTWPGFQMSLLVRQQTLAGLSPT